MDFNEPQWLNELMMKFAIAYEGLWTHNMKSENDILIKKLLWFGALSVYQGMVILSAVELAIKNYPKPPAVAEMIDLCKAECKRFNPENLKLEDQRRHPPSRLLADYMAKHPEQLNNPFKEIFENYSGKDRGAKIIKEIKRKIIL